MALSSSSSGSSSTHSPCAACKFQRRKCTQECIFAPYFPPDQPQKFTNVHRVYGASNVAKLLSELSSVHRQDAVTSLAYEAETRLRDPVYGCVGFISVLHNRLRQLHTDLYAAKKELASYLGPQAMNMFPVNVIQQQQLDFNIPMLGINPQGTTQQQELVRYNSGGGFDSGVINSTNSNTMSSNSVGLMGTFDQLNLNYQIQQLHPNDQQPPLLPPPHYHHHPLEHQLLLQQHPHHSHLKSDAPAGNC